MAVQLPQYPYDSQIFVSTDRIRWQWSEALDVWIRTGTADTLPIVTEEYAGLLSAKDKQLLDSVPAVGGAFGIIVAPQLILSSPENRDGIVVGPITLHSDSIDISCVAADGTPLKAGQGAIQDVPNVTSPGMLPGLQLSLSEKFLNTMCLEISGPQGPQGPKGLQGAHGQDGFTDGPAGERGDPGVAAASSARLTEITVVETDTITDHAVVAVQLDSAAGRFSYTVAKMNVPEDDEPADQFTAIPIQRSLVYPTLADSPSMYVVLDDWQLQIPPGDALPDDPEVLLLQIPADLAVGDTTDIKPIKLTDYIRGVTAIYKAKLTTFQETWLQQMKEFISGKDSAARTALATIAQQVAECEFKRPIEFCLGVQPADCLATSTGDVTTPQTAPRGSNYFSTTIEDEPPVAANTQAPIEPRPVLSTLNPSRCDLPYRMAVAIITDEASPAYTIGIDDPNFGIVNYYNNDKANWESMIDGLEHIQAVALGVLQAPKTGAGFYGDDRDLRCTGCSFPYDSVNTSTLIKTLPVGIPRVTAIDIVNFVEELLALQFCNMPFSPDQVNIFYKSKLLRTDPIGRAEDELAFNKAVDELERRYPNMCFVATIGENVNNQVQADRWLKDALDLVTSYMCYRCPGGVVPGNNNVVVICLTDEAGPIYSYPGYLGPDGESWPFGIPQGTSAWDFDSNRWEEIVALLQSGNNHVRLGVLRPRGYLAPTSLHGGLIKPASKPWPRDTDRLQVTVQELTGKDFYAADLLRIFQDITHSYQATQLYILLDTSGSLGDPTRVWAEASAGVELIRANYPDLVVAIDKPDVGTDTRGEMATPVHLDGYTIQPAADKYLWGWEYIPDDEFGNNILFPSVYVRAKIDFAERWLGRAVNLMQQLIYYWLPRRASNPSSPYKALVLVLTDEAYRSDKYTDNDGYRSVYAAGPNVGYTNYKEDKAAWENWVSALCAGQYVRMGILQLANPGPPYYPEQTDGGPDPYAECDGSMAGGWLVDDATTHSFFGNVQDLLPDTTWGTNLDLAAEDGSLPKDSDRRTISHKVLPWKGFGQKRVVAQDILDFYNEITGNGAYVPDLIIVAVDTTESMRPYLNYWIGTQVQNHNNVTHGVTIDVHHCDLPPCPPPTPPSHDVSFASGWAVSNFVTNSGEPGTPLPGANWWDWSVAMHYDADTMEKIRTMVCPNGVIIVDNPDQAFTTPADNQFAYWDKAAGKFVVVPAVSLSNIQPNVLTIRCTSPPPPPPYPCNDGSIPTPTTGPRVAGTKDAINVEVGFKMLDEIQSAVHAFQRLIPVSGHTIYGYKHPLVRQVDFKGRWLQVTSAAMNLFLNPTNDSGYSSPSCASCGTFHVGDSTWWSNYRLTVCPTIAISSLPCPGCESP